MWLAEVRTKVKRHNQILFSKESFLLADLRHLIEQANRRALILWALDLAEETAVQLAERYPEDLRPREAIDAARAWATGEVKMPIAKQAILNCNALAKELTDPADIARCHAVGQACRSPTMSAPGRPCGIGGYRSTRCCTCRWRIPFPGSSAGC